MEARTRSRRVVSLARVGHHRKPELAAPERRLDPTDAGDPSPRVASSVLVGAELPAAPFRESGTADSGSPDVMTPRRRVVAVTRASRRPLCRAGVGRTAETRSPRRSARARECIPIPRRCSARAVQPLVRRTTCTATRRAGRPTRAARGHRGNRREPSVTNACGRHRVRIGRRSPPPSLLNGREVGGERRDALIVLGVAAAVGCHAPAPRRRPASRRCGCRRPGRRRAGSSSPPETAGPSARRAGQTARAASVGASTSTTTVPIRPASSPTSQARNVTLWIVAVKLVVGGAHARGRWVGWLCRAPPGLDAQPTRPHTCA
jgi:hypothetical protein